MRKSKKDLFAEFKNNKKIFYSTIVILFLLFNFSIYNNFFNTNLKTRNKKFYTALEEKTKIKSLGRVALIGKKMKVGKQIVPMHQITDIKKASSSAISYTVLTNVILGFIAYFVFKPKKISDLHGSSKWGTKNDLTFKKGKDKYFGISLLNDEGVILGTFEGITLRDNAKTHICVTAPTRTGKGVSLIIPTLTKGWRESTVVLDIKGENYQLTSGARKEYWDNIIVRFAPKSENSSSFNPLGEIRFLQEQEIEDVGLITDIITADDNSKDKFWEQAAAELFNGIIIYQMMKKFLQNPTYVIRNGKKIPVSTANLSDIGDFLTDPAVAAFESETSDKTGIQAALHHLANEENIIEKYGKDEETKKFVRERLLELYPTEPEIVNAGRHPKYVREFLAKSSIAEQTFGSILATAKVKIRVFEIPIVKRNTSTSDFRINDIMNYEKPVALYLVIPPSDIITLKPLIKILLVQIVTLLTGEMDYTNQSGHRWRNLMLLDEFPAVGKIEILEEAIGYLAGYGIKVMIILQSLDQLYKIYKKENGFLSNCQTQVFYASNDDTTANYVSKALGDTTVVRVKKSTNIGSRGGSRSIEETKRPLLLPEEVGRFPSDKIIVKLSGRNPLKTEKIVYFEEDEYKDAVKIPYTITESCYDKSKQYILLTNEQKKLNKEYPYRYLPYKKALKMMKEDLLELRRVIIFLENKNSTDPKDIANLKQQKEVFVKQKKGFDIYIKMYNLLLKHYPEVFGDNEDKKKNNFENKTRDIEKEEKIIIKKQEHTFMENIESELLGGSPKDIQSEEVSPFIVENNEVNPEMIVEDIKEETIENETIENEITVENEPMNDIETTLEDITDDFLQKNDIDSQLEEFEF